MAIGYEKINTSAARSRRKLADEIPKTKIIVTPAGVAISHPIYGDGKTLNAFVSDSDGVRCEFENGYIVSLRGGAVRAGLANPHI